MKKIITAIGNEKLNKKLKEENNFEILSDDIQYKEGILEFLENNKNIDFLILSELLPGEIDLKELIEKIKDINSNIQFILFLENKNVELENYLYAKGIYYIFYNNQIEFSKIINLIKNEKDNTNLELKKEIDELKQLLLEKENSKNNLVNFFSLKNKKRDSLNNLNYFQKNNNIINFKNCNNDNSDKNNNDFFNLKEKQNIINLEKNNNQKYNENNCKVNKKINFKNIFFNKKINNFQKEIICVSGPSGVGKSIFSINLAKSFIKRTNKILIIDFDILNNSLHTILGIKKYSEKIRNKIKKNNLLEEIPVEDLIIKVNSNIHLISGINLIFDSKYKISSSKIKNILLKLKEKYDVIIIDTSSECFLDYTKEIMKNSSLNIFITEANILEIKKAKKLLNIYINEWEIPQNNFNILFNKYGQNSIDFSILKNIFSGFSILGKLSIDPIYDLLINKNDKNILSKNLENEYLNICKNLNLKNK